MKPCKSCGQAPAAHFDAQGYWHPPKGCKIVKLSRHPDPIGAWATELIRKAPARVRYYALPASKTVELIPGTYIYVVNQIVLKAGGAGITPNEILERVQKVKGKEALTADKLANYLAKLRYQGAVASAPIK